MEQLRQDAAEWGIVLSDAQLAQFTLYEALLLEWNQRLNLTAIREPAGIRRRHFLDALSCAPITGSLDGARLIDVGTGAGFPGLPLKILFPTLALTLVDSVRKKTTFLAAVVAAMELTGVTILAERAENLGRDPAHREQYDWAVARGVAPLAVLAEYLLPLCRVGGRMLAQKGASALREVDEAGAALTILGGGTAATHAVQLPEQETPHYLVVIPKAAATPARYPRRAGFPSRRPLT